MFLSKVPNPAMTNSFIAEAFDLNDPWGDKTCYGWACCGHGNATACAAAAHREGLLPSVCDNYCAVLEGTPVFMGVLNPCTVQHLVSMH